MNTQILSLKKLFLFATCLIIAARSYGQSYISLNLIVQDVAEKVEFYCDDAVFIDADNNVSGSLKWRVTPSSLSEIKDPSLRDYYSKRVNAVCTQSIKGVYIPASRSLKFSCTFGGESVLTGIFSCNKYDLVLSNPYNNIGTIEGTILNMNGRHHYEIVNNPIVPSNYKTLTVAQVMDRDQRQVTSADLSRPVRQSNANNPSSGESLQSAQSTENEHFDKSGNTYNSIFEKILGNGLPYPNQCTYIIGSARNAVVVSQAADGSPTAVKADYSYYWYQKDRKEDCVTILYDHDLAYGLFYCSEETWVTFPFPLSTYTDAEIERAKVLQEKFKKNRPNLLSKTSKDDFDRLKKAMADEYDKYDVGKSLVSATYHPSHEVTETYYITETNPVDGVSYRSPRYDTRTVYDNSVTYTGLANKKSEVVVVKGIYKFKNTMGYFSYNDASVRIGPDEVTSKIDKIEECYDEKNAKDGSTHYFYYFNCR